jgi:hypothetical protein
MDSVAHVTTSQVGYAGEVLSVTTTGPDVRFMISGYLFNDPVSASTKPVPPDELPGEPAPEPKTEPT